MNVINSLKIPKNEFNYLISNILHNIKYEGKKYIKDFENFDLNDVSKLSNQEFERLCILATFIEGAFEDKNESAPDWVYGSNLRLNKPYIGNRVEPANILNSKSACYRHNVFILDVDFEVM